jgi:hypothetical protein
MQLVLSNAQSELSPLEIGVHALEAIGLGIGGKGQKGGLSAYAEKIGKSHSYVVHVRQAAEVLVDLILCELFLRGGVFPAHFTDETGRTGNR